MQPYCTTSGYQTVGFISQDHFRVASRQFASYFKGKAESLCMDGEDWKYLAHGNPSGEPIVFLHGLGSNKSLWRSQLVSYCDKKYYRVAMDIPGACLTQYFQRKRHSLQELARFLDQYLDRLGLDKIHLTAHSTMTLVATFYAATRPDRVATLTLLSIPDVWSAAAQKPGGTIDRFRQDIKFASLDDAIRQFETMFYDPPKLPRTLHRLGYQQHLQYIDRFLTVMDEFTQSLPMIMAHTRKLQCPVLIINGEYDIYSSTEFVSSLQRHFNNATVINLKKAGHALMLEKPREVVGLHNEFIRQGYVNQHHNWCAIIHNN